jgi:hypothetical protein
MNTQLTQEMQDLVHRGGRPVPARDRGRYFELVEASLGKGPLTNAAVVEAIRSAQRELLRPPAEAA